MLYCSDKRWRIKDTVSCPSPYRFCQHIKVHVVKPEQVVTGESAQCGHDDPGRGYGDMGAVFGNSRRVQPLAEPEPERTVLPIVQQGTRGFPSGATLFRDLRFLGPATLPQLPVPVFSCWSKTIFVPPLKICFSFPEGFNNRPQGSDLLYWFGDGPKWVICWFRFRIMN